MAELVTLARPYAKAAFEVACERNELSQWQSMLALIAAVVSNVKVYEALSVPALTSEQQGSLLLDVCGAELSEGVQCFLRVLAENKRVTLLPEIAQQFTKLKAQYEKTVEINVSSAYAMSEELAKRLSDVLGKKLQCQVKLETSVDPSLIGGVIIKAGDTVIDASIRGRLLKLAEAINS